MSSINDMVQEHLGDQGLTQLTQHLGVDPSTAKAAVAAALPMLVGAMSQRGSQPGAAAVPPVATSNPAAGLLGNLFGGKHSEATEQVSKHSGLDIHQAEKALLFLAPIVMAQLARKRQEGGVAPAQTPAPPAGNAVQQSDGQPEVPETAAQESPGGILGMVERIFHKGS
jgi:hypothetical protein